MTIYIQIKALSKRKPLIERAPFTIDKLIDNSNKLIEYIVCRNVEEYNKQAIEEPLFQYLMNDEIDSAAKTGKIGFDDRKNENQQNVAEAVDNALTCFQDGIFRLFVNDSEIGFDEPIDIKEGDVISFIRLTMLAGRSW